MRRCGLLALALLAGCGAAADHASPAAVGWTTFNDPANGLTARFPSTWQRARSSLTPHLSDPRELISLGTFAVPPARDADCAHLPVAAMRAAGPTDVFVSIQERAGAARDGFAPRARPFALGPADDSEATTCAPDPRPWRSHWVAFTDAGRPLYALVLIGEDAPAERVRELREVLDGLEFDRSTRFVAGPGVAGRLPSGWSLVERQLAAAVGPDQQIAAASFPVPPGPPDGNCTPRAALDRIGPGDAFVYAFAYTGHVTAGLFPPRPEHFALDPDTLAPYECMGESYLLRWSEHGRALQAHVYLGAGASAERRAEALRFLDDLVIEE
ncbi:MAG: hypothetical protein JWM73_2429 [Solirubrobacterales bacterium]|nr:hypothetical protein [Solirubrobacterales bacterium]